MDTLPINSASSRDFTMRAVSLLPLWPDSGAVLMPMVIEIDGYHVRFQRTLSEHRPSLPGIDTYAYARDRDYASADPDQVLAEFRTARATTLRLLQDLDEASLSRSADFEGYGQVTLRSLIHYLCSHDQQHLAGLQWLLGRMHAETGSRPWSVP